MAHLRTILCPLSTNIRNGTKTLTTSDVGVASVNYNYKAELNYLLSVNDENREDIDECDLFWELYETRGQ